MAGIQRGWGESDFSAVSRLFGYPGRGHTPRPAPSAAPVSNPPAEAAALPTEQQSKPTAQDSAAPAPRKFWGFLGNKK
jgi:hypothetical protein